MVYLKNEATIAFAISKKVLLVLELLNAPTVIIPALTLTETAPTIFKTAFHSNNLPLLKIVAGLDKDWLCLLSLSLSVFQQ